MSDNIWEKFGLEAPAEDGEKAQEVADPADPTGDGDGEKAQEPAEPAQTEPEQQEEPTEPEEDPAPEEGDKKEMTAAERRRQAAERRQRERDELTRQLKEESEAKMVAFLKALGLKDESGQPIDTVEKADAYQEAMASQRLKNELKSGKLTPEGLQQVLLQTPQLKALVDEATKARENAQLSDFQNRRELELIEIRKINPSIQSLDDIVRMNTGARFAELVRKHNLSYLDAYKLANADGLAARARAAGEQAARNAAAGKSHLRPTAGGQKEQISVSKSQIELYRRMVPGITIEDIEKAERSRRKE